MRKTPLRIVGDRVLVEWLYDLQASKTIILTDSGPTLHERDMSKAWPVRVWLIGGGKHARRLRRELEPGDYALATLGSSVAAMHGPHSRVTLKNFREMADRVGAKNDCVIIDAADVLAKIPPPRVGQYT